MTRSRLQDTLDRWGSDPKAWPVNAWPAAQRRGLADALGEPEGAQLLSQAQSLDGMLRRAGEISVASVDDRSVRRLLTALQATPLPAQWRPFWAGWWQGAAPEHSIAWPRFAALACSATLGLAVGLSSVGTYVATGLTFPSVQTTTDSDFSSSIFDADSVTGLRP